jgi:predicted DCC family thiol-disulfide oxidoreductase YuxK
MTPALYEACQRAIHVITSDGRVLRAGRAALFILERCGLPWTARVLRVPPLVWMVELGYWLVARNRRFFARFLFRNP